MKATRLHLENFKKFQNKELDFTDETGQAKDLIILIGKNSSGKSTMLQAVTAMLSAATRPRWTVADLEWPGFDINLVNTAWSEPPTVELKVAFSDDELAAMQTNR
ncbi:MAG: AAA family ATPase [Chloroflexota bacterium]